MKGINRFIAFLFFYSFSLHFVFLLGQTGNTAFRGVIIASETKNAIEGVVCKATDINNNVLNYCFSDENGQFSLGSNKNTTRLRFESLGYKKIEIEISSLNDTHNIKLKLEEESISLKEITVSVSPIKRSNDTISYNVASFLTQGDKYLGDILKKLPGIDVSNNGIISYQGETINKFYIEGRDLLGGQYSMATNNLSANAITQVQVLEHNQHIKALKGIEFSDKAAINIKLKSNFIAKPFGEVQAGIGLEPLLYNEKLFASQLGANLQSIVNFKINNTGENISSEMDEKITIENLSSFELLPEQLINPPSLRYLPIPQSRYYFNKTNLSSINNLIVLSKNTELKTNFSFVNNRLKEDMFLKQIYATGNGDLIIDEQSKLVDKEKRFLASITIEHNSLKNYLKNEFKSIGSWQKGNANLKTNEKLLQTETKNRPISFQNNFHALLKYSDTKTIQLKSFIRFIDSKEYLASNLSNTNGLLLDERIKGKYVSSRNKISTAFDLFNNNLDLGLELNYELKDISSDSLYHNFEEQSLSKIDFRNINSKIEEIHAGFSSSYQIKSGTNFVTSIDLPLSFRRYNIEKFGVKTQSYDKVILTPSIRNNYKINHLWELNTRLACDWRQADELSLLSNPFFRSYRVVYIPSNTLNIRKSYNVSSRIKYNDLVEMLFFNFQFVYAINKLNYMPHLHYTENLSYYSTIDRNNTARQFIVNSSVSKTFIPIKLSVTILPSYTKISSRIVQNDNQINNKSNIVSLSLKSEYKGINNTSFNYQISGRANWNDNRLAKKTILKDLSQSLMVYYFPTKKIDLSIGSEHGVLEIEKDKYSNYIFLDGKAKYKMKRFEFVISANNIFNKDAYSITSLSAASSSFRELPLRGREFLFTVSSKF